VTPSVAAPGDTYPSDATAFELCVGSSLRTRLKLYSLWSLLLNYYFFNVGSQSSLKVGHVFF